MKQPFRLKQVHSINQLSFTQCQRYAYKIHYRNWSGRAYVYTSILVLA